MNISVPLDLADVELLSTEIDEENQSFIITVKSTLNHAVCKHCGKKITRFHGSDKPVTLRHLSLFNYRTYIRIAPRRYQCQECPNRPTVTQTLSWYTSRRSTTKEYEKHILLLLINANIQDVSQKERLGYETVVRILEHNDFFSGSTNWEEIKNIPVIGVDEIALKKGHGDFVVIISALIDRKLVLLGVLKDRQKATVKKFFQEIPESLRKTVMMVCSDMYEGYINAAKEVFGEKVHVVVDRFHVSKNYRGAVDSFRKKEMKRLKEEKSEEEYKRLKGVMWAMRKRESLLDEKEKKALNQLFEWSPLLKEAYELSNELTSIFDETKDKKEAREKIRKWEKKSKADK